MARAADIIDGIVGKAMKFDGVDDYVSILNPAQNFANDLTIEFWLNPTNAGSARLNPIDKAYYGEFALTIETGRSLSYYHGQTTVSYMGWSPFSSETIVNNSWQHIVITRDNTSYILKSYYNGVLKKQVTYTIIPSQKTNPIKIAKGYTGYGLSGLIDDVRIFKEAYTQAQVQQLYAEGLKTHQTIAKQ